MSKVFTITEGLENLGALRTGGQGSVYKARRIGPILTAVKLIPTPITSESDEDKNFRNFKNEVEKLKRVNQEPNPNVVKILSSGVTESGAFPFIEMEYVEGPDLEELLKPPHEKIFTIKETIKLADQLSCALSHCHKVGVRHGDIKSNNVKFSVYSGNYVLLDFGLAIMSDEQRRSSMRNAGAIEFMAPEQNEGQMLFQTDIYSYGVVLFELLAGQVPFPLGDNGETARNDVRLKHMESAIPDVLELRRKNLPESWPADKKALEMQVPDWLVALIGKCLQKNPQDRYADGMALHDAISLHAISGGTNAELLAENERLKSLLAKKPAKPAVVETPADTTPADGSVVTLSKPLFFIIMLFLVSFGAIACYYTVFSGARRNGSPNSGSYQDTGNKPDTGNTAGQHPADTQNMVPVTKKKPEADTPKKEVPKKVPDNIPDTSLKPITDTTNNGGGGAPNNQAPDNGQ